MSGIINILPEAVANILAAGEVVERPAAALKELIENSIDSGAEKISVTVKGGGRRALIIVDNGSGMTQEDLVLSTQRHATSKIRDEKDLFSIATFGFRGEALASIAAVSKMNILSSVKGSGEGAEVVISGGEITDVREASPVPGTTVEIRDLFFNVPARLKFLKSDATETGHINRALVHQALGNYKTGFDLIVDSRSVHEFPPAENLLERISSVSGSEISHNLLPVNAERGGFKLRGFVSKPVYTRRSRSHQYIFLNSRFIRDKTINRALYEAYRNVIPGDRHPVYYLYLDVDMAGVDVNVHPSKMEVRFSRANEVFEFVYGSVLNSLKGFNQEIPRQLDAGGELAGQSVSLSRAGDGRGLFSFPEKRPLVEPIFSGPSRERGEREELREHESGYSSPEEHRPHNESSGIGGDLFLNMPASELRPEFSLDPLSIKIVGQLFDSLIIIESNGRLILIDQHAAHERVLFERFQTRVREGRIEIQELLFPVNVELSSEQVLVVTGHGKELESIGLSVEFFGGNTCIIRSVPVLLSKENPKDVLMDLLDVLSEKKGRDSYETVINRMVQTAACRGAVKAGDSLERSEIESIVSTLFSENVLSTCPHGRPFMVSMEKDSIMRRFLRS